VRLYALGIGALCVALLGLFYYKWSGAWASVSATQLTHALKKDPSVIMSVGALRATLGYFRLIWPALAFGLVIGALVRAALPARVVMSSLGGAGIRAQLLGGVAGAPLMLCSCCITPISAALRARGAKLGPSLAVMLGSPGLNIAALMLTFLLFPARMAITRVAAAATIVFGISWLVGQIPTKPRVLASKTPATVEEDEAAPISARDFAVRFVRSFARLFVATVPLIVAGVFLSGLLLPHAVQLGAHGTIVAVTVVALIGTLVALPTFFEIPVALLLLHVGAPPGAAIALLIAGPIVNLPSLFVVARESGVRVAAALGASVFAIATIAGLVI
jgi:uncharacterized membrane protein YraQ (UPF0718 family)